MSDGNVTRARDNRQQEDSTPTSPLPGEEQRSEGLAEPPNWLLPPTKFWETAKEVNEDNRGCRFVLLSAVGLQTSGGPAIWDNLLPLLWTFGDPAVFPDSWLRTASGLSMRAAQEIAETSELGARYKCLDCEVPLVTRGREHYTRRRVALTDLLAIRPGDFAPTKTVSELLCPICEEVHRYARLIRIEELRTMADSAYGSYLLTVEWLKRRDQKLDAAEYRCQGCKWEGLPLEVHHRVYDRLGDELFPDLTVYCPRCHRCQHGFLHEAS